MFKGKKQSGFTLIEIMVAVSIFGIFIAMVSTSLTGIIRQQQQTNTLRLTQQNTRNIMESISREGRNSNGELDKNGARVVHAFAKDGDKLVFMSTDLTQPNIDLREVTKTEYFLENDVLKKTTSKKKIGESFGAPGETVGLNSSKDLKIVDFKFNIESDPNDPDKPPEVKNLSIRSESEKGKNFDKAEYRANIELETSIVSRGY